MESHLPQRHQVSCPGPCSTSYAVPSWPSRGNMSRHTFGSKSGATVSVAAGLRSQCSLDTDSQRRRSSWRAWRWPSRRQQASQTSVAQVASPPAVSEELAQDTQDEQPAPFERVESGEAAFSALTGALPAGALYEVLDLRKELAAFLQEAERPLSAGLAGLQEVATSANWSLPEADQQLIQAARLKHERELTEQGEEPGAQLPAENTEGMIDLAPAAVDPAEFEIQYDDPALTALVQKGEASDAENPDQTPILPGFAAEKGPTSPQQLRRRKRAVAQRQHAAAASPAAHPVWRPDQDGQDRVLAAMEALKARKRAYLRPQDTDVAVQANKNIENPLATQFINLTHKLLTRDEEQVLAKYLVDIRPYEAKQAEMMAAETEQPPDEAWAEACGFAQHREAFAIKVQRGRMARDLFKCCNLRMVAKIAHRYTNQGVEMEELLNAGIVGLDKAITRFDPSRGFKFSTYSHWWIRQTIQRTVIQHGRVIRLPGHLYDLRYKIRNASEVLGKSLNRHPSNEEIADYLKMPVRKIQNIKSSFNSPRSLEMMDEVSKQLDKSGRGASIAGMIAEEPEVEETVPDPQAQDLFDSGDWDRPTPAANSVVRAVILASLSLLDPKERIVMRMRYGLDDGQPRTLEEIGRYFKVTRERVRQVEIRAFRRLKQAPKHGALLDEAVHTSFMSNFI